MLNAGLFFEYLVDTASPLNVHLVAVDRTRLSQQMEGWIVNIVNVDLQIFQKLKPKVNLMFFFFNSGKTTDKQ